MYNNLHYLINGSQNIKIATKSKIVHEGNKIGHLTN
jgi:hypothetical protein